MATDRTPICKGCNLPFPADWCWQNKLLDCWAGRPPRNIDQRAVLAELRDLRDRVDLLEQRDD